MTVSLALLYQTDIPNQIYLFTILLTMKKSTLKALALSSFALFTTPVFAQDGEESAIYDFSGFQDATILNLFYNALQDGRKYPTMAEFEAAGIQASDLAFVRSHVRKAQILDDADRVQQKTTSGRDLFMNTPLGIGSGEGGYPMGAFNNDVFSMWNYTNLWGSWNRGLFQAPGCNIDVAHKNGTTMFSGIKFFESWTSGGGDEGYSALITKKDGDGNFMYVKPMINAFMFFGQDGVNYNWEDYSYNDEDIVAFHKALYKEAEAQGFTDYKSAIYTAQNMLTSQNVNALFGDETGRTHATFLNYMSGDFTSSYAMGASVNAAKEAMGTTEDLYTGVWIVQMASRSWKNLTDNPEINVCLWGEHGQSRFFSNSAGSDAYERQFNYQNLLETGFSGTAQNPANLIGRESKFEDWGGGLEGFVGLANWIPERSAIQGDLHFQTHFTLGNGDRYYYKGKKSHAGEWYNIGSQDIVPTYRWLVYDAGTTTTTENIIPDYNFKDAYIGGTSLQLKGVATATGTDVVLYKTALTNAGTNAYAKVAVKSLKEGNVPSNLYVLVRVNGEWQEYAVGEIAGGSWQEKAISLDNIGAGAVVERIGLRVKGDDANYDMLVGKLEINSDSYKTPAAVKDLVVEVKEETKTSMAAKLFWDVDAQAAARADWGLLYNDEANIHHFEILYKNGAEGKVAEVGRTTSWATLIPEIIFESATDEPYIGVRPVSTDLQTYGKTLWVKVARGDQGTLPEREVIDSYGKSELDPNAEGVETAQKYRFLTKVTTTGGAENINYTEEAAVPGGKNHVHALEHTLRVSQGQEVSMNMVASNLNNDGLKYCFGGAWIDFNASGNFDHAEPMTGSYGITDKEAADGLPSELGERVFRIGNVKAPFPEIQTPEGTNVTFTIPEDATPGQSRMRIVFSDAWFDGAFVPVGLLAKGFSIDFNVIIEGTNPGREVVDTRDEGEAEEPVMLEGGVIEAIDNATVNNGASTLSYNDGKISFANVEKAWVYTSDGKFVKFANNNPASLSTEGYAPGVYLVKMQSNNVIRSQKVVIK